MAGGFHAVWVEEAIFFCFIRFRSHPAGPRQRAIIFQRSAQSRNASDTMNEMHKLHMMNTVYEANLSLTSSAGKVGTGSQCQS